MTEIRDELANIIRPFLDNPPNDFAVYGIVDKIIETFTGRISGKMLGKLHTSWIGLEGEILFDMIANAIKKELGGG